MGVAERNGQYCKMRVHYNSVTVQRTFVHQINFVLFTLHFVITSYRFTTTAAALLQHMLETVRQLDEKEK